MGTGLVLASSCWIPAWLRFFLITSNVLEFRIVAMPTLQAKLGKIQTSECVGNSKTSSLKLCILTILYS